MQTNEINLPVSNRREETPTATLPNAQPTTQVRNAPAASTSTAMPWRATIGWGIGGAVCFHLAFLFSPFAFLVAGYLFAVFRLAEVATPRRALWVGITMDFLCFAPQLEFFYRIFGPSAAALWAVPAFWLGMYVMTQHCVRARLGARWAMCLAPALWLGFEFFRSELYFLRFTWLSAGYAFAEGPNRALIYWPGVYGVGALLMAAMVWPQLRPDLTKPIQLIALALTALLSNVELTTPETAPSGAPAVRVAAIQIEHKHDLEVLEALKQLRRAQPDAELLVLSELAFDGPVPARVRKWCAQEKVHLVAGGKDPVNATGTVLYNTVFIIGPDGRELHKQAKTIPIQVMADGLPAPSQKLWESPWGKLGFCICYDKSFTRVTDELVRKGAQALIVPTADEIEWGAHEHRLHARIAPVRAAEHTTCLCCASPARASRS